MHDPWKLLNSSWELLNVPRELLHASPEKCNIARRNCQDFGGGGLTPQTIEFFALQVGNNAAPPAMKIAAFLILINYKIKNWA